MEVNDCNIVCVAYHLGIILCHTFSLCPRELELEQNGIAFTLRFVSPCAA
jgi:hypothetical protein